jgi:predicted MFS family arabinose efflux permease
VESAGYVVGAQSAEYVGAEGGGLKALTRYRRRLGPRLSFLSRLPLTDRITFFRELWSGSFYGVFAGIALPLVPIMARKIGMSPEAITAMLTMQFVGALSGVVLGHLAERRPKMPFVMWPNLAARSAVALLAFARHPTAFLVIASLFYFLLNVTGPAYSSIMRTNYSHANRGRLMGNIRIIIMIVSGAVSAAAGLALIRNEEVVRWLFLVAGVFGVFSSLTFATIKVRRDPLSPSLAVPRPRGSPLRILAANRPLLVFLGVLVLCATPDKLSVPLEPLWMVDVLHIDYAQASFVLGTVLYGASVAGYYIWARALKRTNSFTLLAVIVFVFAARYAAMALARTGSQLIPMSILSGLANAGWDLVPLFCILDLADAGSFTLAFGLHTTLFGIRGMIGPTLGTLLYSAGVPLNVIFLGIAAVIAMGGVMMLRFGRRHGRPPGLAPGYVAGSSASSASSS